MFRGTYPLAGHGQMPGAAELHGGGCQGPLRGSGSEKSPSPGPLHSKFLYPAPAAKGVSKATKWMKQA